MALQDYLKTFSNNLSSGFLASASTTKPSQFVAAPKKPLVMAPSNTSATAIKPTTITPPKTSAIKTPAAQQYIQSQTQNINPNAGAFAGINDTLGKISSGLSNLKSQPQSTQGSSTSESSPQSAYLKYLTGMFDPKNVDSARKSKEDSMQRLADIRNESEKKSYDARKEYEATLDTPGMLKDGAREAATQGSRRNNSELADLAIQESAAARSAQVASDTYDSYINAGKTVYEAEQAAKVAQEQSFSLSAGEERYQLNPTTGQYEKIATGTPKGTESDLKTSVVDIGGKKVLINTQTGDTIRELGAGEAIPEDAANSPQNILSALTELKGHPGKSFAVGKTSLFNFIPGTSGASFVDKLNSVKSLLTLPNLGLLKGAMSDNDLKFINSAGTSLATSNTQEDFNRELDKIITKIQAAVQKQATSGSGEFAEEW